MVKKELLFFILKLKLFTNSTFTTPNKEEEKSLATSFTLSTIHTNQ